jgi:hypothetical protein
MAKDRGPTEIERRQSRIAIKGSLIVMKGTCYPD